MQGFDILGYLLFAFVTSITPGPNNLVLFSHGKNYGFQDSNRLMIGIAAGFTVMLYITGYGMAELLLKHATFNLVLKIICSVWLFYLAIILSRVSFENKEESGNKIGFIQGFLMQFSNPKAWIMAVTGAGAFLPHFKNPHLSVSVFALSFGVVGVPCMLFWIKSGDVISKLLKSENAHRVIGTILFCLMALSIVMIWI